MSYAENLPLIPPSLAAPKAVQAAVATLNRITKAASEASGLAYDLEQRLEALADEQRHAAAAQYLAGKQPARDDEAVRRLTEELEAARRDAAALDEAATLARRQAVDVIGTHVDPWRRSLDPELATARAGLLEAVATLEVAGRRLADAEATEVWLRQWPRGREFSANATGPVLRGTAPFTANRDPLPWLVMLDALRAAATAPAPKPKPVPPAPSQLTGAEVVGPRRREAVGDAA